MQNYGQGHVCLLPFLTHFADLSSWEYAKKLKAILSQVEAAGVQVSSSLLLRGPGYSFLVIASCGWLTFLLSSNIISSGCQSTILRETQMPKQHVFCITGGCCGTWQQTERDAVLKAPRLPSSTPICWSASDNLFLLWATSLAGLHSCCHPTGKLPSVSS